MGGNAEGIGNVTITGEFNFWADPEAAYIFLQKVQSPVVTVTWELCWLYMKISLVGTGTASPQINKSSISAIFGQKFSVILAA